MKYYIDTEFLEGTQIKRVLGFNLGHTKPTIDLISIGIVAEDGREYYAISKEFNLKEAWNRYELEKDYSVGARIGALPIYKKIYWLRENVLKPIYRELITREIEEQYGEAFIDFSETKYTLKEFRNLVKKYGKTNAQIAEEVIDFINTNDSFIHSPYNDSQKNIVFQDIIELYGSPTFYGYYADYDWVVFCWLFGKMINLPQGFPMYCNDLKQMMDEKSESIKLEWGDNAKYFDMLNHLKTLPNYPKQTNEHNAIADARWNKGLHEFLMSL